MKRLFEKSLAPLFFGIFGCFLLAACSGIGPNYVKPNVPFPSQWIQGNSRASVTTSEAWWRQFHDPILNTLIEKQAVCNLELKAAYERVNLAQKEYAIASAQLFPVTGIQTFSPNGTGVKLTQVIALGTLLELDIFGRIRQTRARAAAGLEAEQANHAFSKLNLYAEIATSYLKLREAQTKEAILRQNLHGNQQILLLLKSRYKTGSISYLNLAQQEALIETQLAEIDQIQSLLMAVIHKIEILTGNPPGKLTKQLSPRKPVPKINTPIRLGIPSSILNRRPDIIAAERRIAASHADIRVATANLFPTISVGWLLGWQTETLATNILALSNHDSTAYGMFNAPLLNLGLYRTLDLKKQEKVFAILQYQITIMRALHEVETQAQYCVHYQASISHLKRAVEKKRLVLKLATDAYQKGAFDFNTVLRAEEDLNRLEMLHLDQIILYQTARIELYKALGGDWVV